MRIRLRRGGGGKPRDCHEHTDRTIVSQIEESVYTSSIEKSKESFLVLFTLTFRLLCVIEGVGLQLFNSCRRVGINVHEAIPACWCEVLSLRMMITSASIVEFVAPAMVLYSAIETPVAHFSTFLRSALLTQTGCPPLDLMIDT